MPAAGAMTPAACRLPSAACHLPPAACRLPPAPCPLPPAPLIYIPPMPIYEYHCASCGQEFETLVRANTKVACPSCESAKVERRMSLPARPAGGGNSPDFSRLGPPGGGAGGCGSGGCGCH